MVIFDRNILGFNYNQPKQNASLSFNTVNQQHVPKSYENEASTPASGNYWRTYVRNMFLNPAPRSQLGVPTNKIFSGKRSPYYRDILGNANWVRGNEFGVKYPYRKDKTFVETVSVPSVEQKGMTVDYMGGNAKVVMRNNSPFYPYPSQRLLENRNYWAYPHEHKYLNGQPIYNYGHGLMEGVSRGKYMGGKGYNPYLVEEFCGTCGGGSGGSIGVGIALILIFIVLCIGFSR